jgi:hypothetical protein
VAKSSSDAKITLSDEDLLGLESRLELNKLTSSDLEILKNVLSFNGWLQGQLEEKSVSILKLRNLFGIKTEKKSP